MLKYRVLEKVDMHTLYQTFLHAFSDYQVNLNIPFAAFQTMLKRRGFMPNCSIGAFTEPGGELVGFILNGVRDWSGKLTAYDLGTGVTPSFRKQGISRNMFGHMIKLLKQNGVNQYLLEVLEKNRVAFELYKKQGLSIARQYSCFRLQNNSGFGRALSKQVDFPAGFRQNEWDQVKQLWDFQPSWQNSIDSIRAVQDELVFAAVRKKNDIVGYGIIDKNTGDIPQIAVHKQYRRRGIAAEIVTALAQSTSAGELVVLNADASCAGLKLFLSALGFEATVNQYEMMADI